MEPVDDKSEAGRALAQLGAAKGGKARAKALTPEERRDIARYAARQRWGEKVGLPKAAYSGELTIGEVTISCHVLEDTRRLLSGRAVTKAMGLTGRGQGMARFLTSKSLNAFVSEKLSVAIRAPIVFTAQVGGQPTHGYEAWVLPELCNVVIEAADRQLLTHQQKVMVQRAKILQRAFSTVGITALIDEATGYQAHREKDALIKILEAYISRELLPWTQRFPDEFFHQIHRLHGWKSPDKNMHGPRIVGKLINEYVYKKLPREVLPELQRRNPTLETGYRRHRHHQFLTPDTGHPHLDKQIVAVMTLMRISNDKHEFKRHLDKAFPKKGSQPELPFPERTD